jgi:hypothetical protein
MPCVSLPSASKYFQGAVDKKRQEPGSTTNLPSADKADAAAEADLKESLNILETLVASNWDTRLNYVEAITRRNGQLNLPPLLKRIWMKLYDSLRLSMYSFLFKISTHFYLRLI